MGDFFVFSARKKRLKQSKRRGRLRPNESPFGEGLIPSKQKSGLAACQSLAVFFFFCSDLLNRGDCLAFPGLSAFP